MQQILLNAWNIKNQVGSFFFHFFFVKYDTFMSEEKGIFLIKGCTASKPLSYTLECQPFLQFSDLFSSSSYNLEGGKFLRHLTGNRRFRDRNFKVTGNSISTQYDYLVGR